MLGPGDLLDISVFDSPDLVARVRVSSEGEISFPLLGKLRASGMTPQEFQDLIRDQLMKRDFVKDPQVAVFVLEYANQVVYVLGEVAKPGAYPVVGSHRLFDFISAAGGFTPLAGKSIKVTTQAHPESPVVARFSRALNVSADNIEIGIGDTIVVEQAGVIYVVGNVMHPGGFLLDSDQRLTVMKALALAAGTSPGASMKGARLIRATPQSRQEIPFDLSKVMASKAPDLVLQDQDILYVPNSAMRSGLNRGVEAAIQASVGAAIYRW
jgi:polysaccharide export outer membrane protein